MVAPHSMVHLCSSSFDDIYGPKFAFVYDVIYMAVTIDLFNLIMSISIYLDCPGFGPCALAAAARRPGFDGATSYCSIPYAPLCESGNSGAHVHMIQPDSRLHAS